MGARTGIATQLGIGVEATYGTGVAPSIFLPIVSEALTNKISPAESKAIIAGRMVLDSSQWAPGNKKVGGSVGLELTSSGLELVLEHMFGTVVKTGTGSAVTRTFTPGFLAGKSLSVQVGRPAIDGTINNFTYTGSKVDSWALAGKSGEVVTLGLTLVCMDELVAGVGTAPPALGTPVYGTPMPIHFVNASIGVAGATVAVSEWTLSGNNSLNDGRYVTSQTTIREPLQKDLRAYTGELTAEFESMVQYDHYLNADEVALTISCGVVKGGQMATLQFTTNVRFNGGTPNTNKRDVTPFKAAFSAVGTSDSAAITAVLVNATA